MRERWRPVKGYEELYEVSSLGRIRNIKTEKFRKCSTTPFGYSRLCLYSYGKTESHFVHRLVLQAFTECPDGKTMVNHINGNKLDNVLKNLEWVTASENIKHAYKLGLMDKRGEKNGTNKLTIQEVVEIRDRLKGGEPQVKIAKKFGITPGTVWKIKTKIIWNYQL